VAFGAQIRFFFAYVVLELLPLGTYLIRGHFGFQPGLLVVKRGTLCLFLTKAGGRPDHAGWIDRPAAIGWQAGTSIPSTPGLPLPRPHRHSP